MTPCEAAKGYARDVVDGRIVVGKYVRLACQRFLTDLERAKASDYPFMFDEDLADSRVEFMQLLPHVKGRWHAKGEKLVLQPWQCFVECNLFGWVYKDSRLRRFRESYEEVPRKNGKSTRLAARGIMLLTADGEAGAEIYSGATTEKQALEVYRTAWQMVKKLPPLMRSFELELAGNANNPGPMYRTRDMSRFEPMIGKPGDGASPHCAIIDEYHEHDSDHMVDTMQTGMGSREQPLLSIITTAGSNLGGPCYEKRLDVIRILEGTAEDERSFGIIYGIDFPDDPWDDPAMMIKANPNYGISVFREYLDAELGKARRSAGKQNIYRTKHLNEWVGAKTGWMNMLMWQRQKREFQIKDFAGCRCWFGVDLASKKDVTALVMLFRKGDEYFCIPRFWIPEAALEDNKKYMEFVTGDQIIVTPGQITDYEFLEEEIKSAAKQVSLQDIAIDPHQATSTITRLMHARLPMIEFAQNVRNISEPMKEVEAQVLAGKLWHDGNRAMTWMMGNVVAYLDAKEHIYPRKEDGRNKIDGPVALIMAMARAMLDKQQPNYKIFFV